MTASARSRAQLGAIHRRADAHFQQVQAEAGAAMLCRAGCDGCCQDDLSVLLVEALAVCTALERLPAEVRAARLVAAERMAPPCAMLETKSGRCAIYPQRPLICRTHGLPLLIDDGAGALSLSLCELNFVDGHTQATALDSRPLSAALLVTDAMLRAALGLTDPLRIPLRLLSGRGRRALPKAARQEWLVPLAR